jgi:hypothetical protein
LTGANSRLSLRAYELVRQSAVAGDVVKAAGKNRTQPNLVTVISMRTEERPIHFDFTKNDFLGHSPPMVKLAYDPFPRASWDEVVRREIIGRELFVTAVLKADEVSLALRAGRVVALNRTEYLLKRTIPRMSEGTVEIEGSRPLGRIDPEKTLTNLRKSFSRRA